MGRAATKSQVGSGARQGLLSAIPSAPRAAGSRAGEGITPGWGSSGAGDPVRCHSPKEENILCDGKGFTFF